MSKVVIIMGSKADIEWAKQISNVLESFDIKTVSRIASAHKVPLKCYNLIKEYEKENVVFVLWGAFAQKKAGLINPAKHFILQSAHPSPFSVHRGFYGSKVFSKINECLTSKQKSAIDW